MSGGNGTTIIAWPGRSWQMFWINGGFSNFQLDIVGFLAVLGEGSVLANSQVSALSPLFLLPRILPAPQALLPPNRPVKLPSTQASVTGVHSGNTKEHVHHVAHILLGDELRPKFTVRCVKITKKVEPLKRAQNVNTIASVFDKVIRKASTWLSSESGTPSTPERPVTANTTGPLSLVTLLGFLLSICLFITSMIFGDGFSAIATVLLSALSTLTGFANKWKLKLPRKAEGSAPPGDTVIRYPNGSYLVAKCDETIARELFFAPEEIEYWISNPMYYRIVALLGTIILMLGIIALANSKLQLQFAWAGAYIIINAAHWIAAAVPPRMHWDLSCYELTEQGIESGPESENFTEALWKAIVLTKSTRWVRNGKAAPETRVWDDWLHEAETKSKFPLGVDSYIDNAPLTKPVFPGGHSTQTGRKWKRPRDWDPRKEWNRLNLEAEQAEAVGAIAPAEAA